MQIDNYLYNRLRADAAHAIELAEVESAITHPGMLGRFREILIANLLNPWLPPYCKCLTGMVIESKNQPRTSTQDDILVIDTSLSPPVLANSAGPEGVFLINSVLLRIEVKSRLEKEDFSKFAKTSSEVTKMRFEKPRDFKKTIRIEQPYNILVAFDSNVPDVDFQNPDFELKRLYEAIKEHTSHSPIDGFISALCIAKKGFWFLNPGRELVQWGRLHSDERKDYLACLVALAANTAYRAHAQRQGRDPAQGLDVGFGNIFEILKSRVAVAELPDSDNPRSKKRTRRAKRPDSSP